MNDNNPFFMNFNTSDFMRQFAIPEMDSQYSKKLIDAHKKNLDSFVKANQLVTDGYKAVASKQMEIFQNNLNKMKDYSPEQAAALSPEMFQEGAKQMKELVEIASKAHQEAFAILSSRGEEILEEAKIK